MEKALKVYNMWIKMWPKDIERAREIAQLYLDDKEYRLFDLKVGFIKQNNSIEKPPVIKVFKRIEPENPIKIYGSTSTHKTF